MQRLLRRDCKPPITPRSHLKTATSATVPADISTLQTAHPCRPTPLRRGKSPGSSSVAASAPWQRRIDAGRKAQRTRPAPARRLRVLELGRAETLPVGLGRCGGVAERVAAIPEHPSQPAAGAKMTPNPASEAWRLGMAARGDPSHGMGRRGEPPKRAAAAPEHPSQPAAVAQMTPYPASEAWRLGMAARGDPSRGMGRRGEPPKRAAAAPESPTGGA